MKYLSVFSLAFISGISWSQTKKIEVPAPPPAPVETQAPENQGPYKIVDEQAEFPGGFAALRTFLAQNVIYPQAALDKNIQGKSHLRFIVMADGTIKDVTVLRGIADCPECDAEAVRLVNKMPKWNPGKIAGKPVDSYYNLPVTFYVQ